MRLTLRTLLAYLDGNLEPADAEDIGQKIEESEFATKLVHLIRDCTRRLRLDVPEMIGRGLANDPNSVAEYLEYRLDDDQVPEFEKICLESEVHLAEVASCHQILTLVLGAPAEIEPALRTRLYALGGRVDAPPLQGDAVQHAATAPMPPTPPVVRRAKPEVPDYLRESRWRWWPVAAMVIVGTLLTFAGVLAFGPPHLRQRLTAMWSDPAAEGVDQEPAEAAPTATGPTTTAPADTAAADSVVAPPAEPIEEDVPDGPPAPIEPSESPSEASPDAIPPAEPEMPLDAPPADTPLPEVAPGDAAAAAATLPAAPADKAPGGTAPLPPEPAPLTEETPEVGAPVPGIMPADGTPAVVADATSPPAPGPGAAPARAPAEGFGRFTSKREVLLKVDAGSKDWLRLPAASPLKQGDELLSLPLFRPTINLSSNINVQADGPARFKLAGWTDDSVPILDIDYGRFLMLTIGKGSNPLAVRFDGHEALVTFVDPESNLALEVVREPLPGQDPVADPAPVVVHIYATSGLIRIRDEAGTIEELAAPAMASLVAGAVQRGDGANFPAWPTTEMLTEAELGATRELGGYLENDKPIGLQLRELANSQHALSRKREVRTLAVRCLAQMGDFEASLVALDDPDLRHYWSPVMGELQSAVARGPQTAGQVEAALVRHRGANDAALLYRMLWGYTGAQLKAGSDRELVEALARNDALIVRVMGILTLEDITGATLGYHPEDTEFQRRVPYNSWQRRIGKIVPKSESGRPGR